MRKPTFCICENKNADQLRGTREAGQRLCFRYIHVDTTIPLLSNGSVQFVSGLVGNSKDRFCHDVMAHLRVTKAFELRHEKTNVLHMRKQKCRSASRYT